MSLSIRNQYDSGFSEDVEFRAETNGCQDKELEDKDEESTKEYEDDSSGEAESSEEESEENESGSGRKNKILPKAKLCLRRQNWVVEK